ncbi:MAG: S9 family peptidase [Candidatus Bipolaricaulota bacterium]
MKPVEISDLLLYRFLSSVELSPAGEHAAFLVKQADAEKNEYSSNLFLVDVERRSVRALTGSGKDGDFAWDPEGPVVFFLSRRVEVEGKMALFQIRVDGGEAEQIATLPHKADGLRALGGGRFLYTARLPQSGEPTRNDAKDYEVLEEIPFWMNGTGFTDRRRKHVFSFDLAAAVPVDLTEPEIEVESFDVRGDRVVLLGRRFSGVAPIERELWTTRVDGSERHRVSLGDLRCDGVRFCDERTLVLTGTTGVPYGLGQNRELFLLNLESGVSSPLTPNWDRSIGNSIGSDCRHGAGPVLRVEGDAIYVTVTNRSHVELVRVSRDGVVQTMVASPGSIDAYAVRGGTTLTVELRPGTPQEIYLYEGARASRLTALNQDALHERAISEPIPFTATSSDGTEVEAWVFPPADIGPSHRVPLVLSIHGGPRTASSSVFFHETQVLAGKGYAVVVSNPRGSSGRSDAFADLRGKYGTIDFDDLMAVVDEALRRFAFLDPARLAVMGGSYGGFMTNWIIGHTDRFRAAVSQRSISNWVHKFCSTDIGYFFNHDQIGETPWSDAGEKLWWHSPLRYADRVKTPTLFIHSEQDYRCTLPEGIQMFTALRYHGVDARLVMFREENHELSRSGKPKHRVRRLEEIAAWFETRLAPSSAPSTVDTPPAASDGLPAHRS